jgi:hypothetical protein
MVENLTEANFVLYTIQHYDNNCCETIEEFESDVNLIKNIRRLLIKYEKTGILKERLILNHLTCFFNVFPTVPAVRMLFLKLNKAHLGILKPFLVFLGRCPSLVELVAGKTYIMSDIRMDFGVVTALRNLKNKADTPDAEASSEE